MLDINTINLLFYVLVVCSIFSIIVFDYDLIHPIVVICVTNTISVFFGMLNVDTWELTVGIETTIFVTACLMAYILGSLIFEHINGNDISVNNIGYNNKYFKDVKLYKIIIATVFMIVLLYYSFEEIYEISLLCGNTEGITNMIKSVRYPLERGEVRFSRWMSYRECAATSIAMVFLYYFCNSFIYGKSVNVIIKYVPPICCFIPFLILTTGRRDMVHFILSGVVIGSIIYMDKKRYEFTSKFKIAITLLSTVLISISVFLLMGTLTGKVSIGSSNIFRVLSHYLGLSYPALDILLKQPLIENYYIGQNTLINIYRNLNALGFNLEMGRLLLPFVKFNGIDTNVYSAFGRQYMDYGYIGTVLLSFCLGISLTFWYEYVKTKIFNPVILTIYGMFAYIPYFLFLDDQFMTVFNTTTLYKIVLIYITFVLLNSNLEKTFIKCYEAYKKKEHECKENRNSY